MAWHTKLSTEHAPFFMDWTWHLDTNDQFSYELVIYKNKIQDFNLEIIMIAYQNTAKSDEQTLSQQEIIMQNI